MMMMMMMMERYVCGSTCEVRMRCEISLSLSLYVPFLFIQFMLRCYERTGLDDGTTTEVSSTSGVAFAASSSLTFATSFLFSSSMCFVLSIRLQTHCSISRSTRSRPSIWGWVQRCKAHTSISSTHEHGDAATT